MPRDGTRQRKSFMRGLVSISHIGFAMIGCVLFGIIAGSFLDRRFGTSAWFTLIFSLLGVAASFKVLIDFAKRM